MDALKDWLENRIKIYKEQPNLFADADSIPSVAYELGRYDSLIEIQTYMSAGNGEEDV